MRYQVIIVATEHRGTFSVESGVLGMTVDVVMDGPARIKIGKPLPLEASDFLKEEVLRGISSAGLGLSQVRVTTESSEEA